MPVAVSTRDEAGAVPQRNARPGLVSNLFVGEDQGRWLAGRAGARETWPRYSGSFLSVTVGVANLNESNRRRAPGNTNVDRIRKNPGSCTLKRVVTRDLNDILLKHEI